MAQLGSVCGMALNAFTVSGKKNECCMASARSNCFCASAEHEVLKSTRPSCSGAPVRGSLSADTGPARTRDAISRPRIVLVYVMSTLPRLGSAMVVQELPGQFPDDCSASPRRALGDRLRQGQHPARIVDVQILDQAAVEHDDA